MASLEIIKDGKSTKGRLHWNVSGKRYRLRLSGKAMATAEATRTHIAAIVEAIESGKPLAAETQTWIYRLPYRWRAQLAAKGLKPCEEDPLDTTGCS